MQVIVLLLVSNTVAISADLAAMADALRLLIGGPPLVNVLMFGAVCVLLQIYMQYTRYVAVLKWITLSLLSYFGAVLMVDVRWSELLDAMLSPRIVFEKDYLMMVVAIFGIALSPSVVFWQSSQEAEDQRVQPKREPLVEAPEQAPKALERIRLDTYIGMAAANLVGLAIIITTAATLHANGINKIEDSAQAAEALRPIAGDFAFAVFALGIIGTGLLAVPVLAGSAAYAIGEARRWPVGLARPPLEAKAFYATLAAATLVGVGINFIGLDPMRALYWSAVVMGVTAVPLLAMMMRMASRPEVMGEFTIGGRLRMLGWMATAIMAMCVAAMGITAVR